MSTMSSLNLGWSRGRLMAARSTRRASGDRARMYITCAFVHRMLNW